MFQSSYFIIEVPRVRGEKVICIRTRSFGKARTEVHLSRFSVYWPLCDTIEGGCSGAQPRTSPHGKCSHPQRLLPAACLTETWPLLQETTLAKAGLPPRECLVVVVVVDGPPIQEHRALLAPLFQSGTTLKSQPSTRAWYSRGWGLSCSCTQGWLLALPNPDFLTGVSYRSDRQQTCMQCSGSAPVSREPSPRHHMISHLSSSNAR